MTTPHSAAHVTRTATIDLRAPIERVFPLFTPLGEKNWAEGWNPHMIYPPSGAPEVGAVFTTEHPGEAQATWIIVDYAPEDGLIRYARLAPQSHAALISVQCATSAQGATLATITYTLTALSEAGHTFLAHLSETHYREWIGSWETDINHFLAHAD